MTSFHALIAMLQVIAAFLIFIAGYLALFVFVIIALLTATFIYKGADFVWAYTVKSNSQHFGDSSERNNNVHSSLEPRQTIHSTFSGVPLFHSHKQR
jgi:hypothetical protein